MARGTRTHERAAARELERVLRENRRPSWTWARVRSAAARGYSFTAGRGEGYYGVLLGQGRRRHDRFAGDDFDLLDWAGLPAGPPSRSRPDEQRHAPARRCPRRVARAAPSFSVVLPLTLTAERIEPAALGDRRAHCLDMRRDLGTFGDHGRVDVLDPPAGLRARVRAARAAARGCRHRGGARRCPETSRRCRPAPAAPRIASVIACSSTSASEWPSSPRSNGISTPPMTSRRPGTSAWTSKPCPTERSSSCQPPLLASIARASTRSSAVVTLRLRAPPMHQSRRMPGTLHRAGFVGDRRRAHLAQRRAQRCRRETAAASARTTGRVRSSVMPTRPSSPRFSVSASGTASRPPLSSCADLVDQPAELLLGQARTRRIVHQHAVVVAGARRDRDQSVAHAFRARCAAHRQELDALARRPQAPASAYRSARRRRRPRSMRPSASSASIECSSIVRSPSRRYCFGTSPSPMRAPTAGGRDQGDVAQRSGHVG